VDYITKPFEMGEVLARINLHLALRSTRKELEDRNAQLVRYEAGLEEQVAQRTAELEQANAILRQEVAERKVAEESLRESQHLLGAIVNNSNAVIYVKDAGGHYLMINRRFEELFHVTKSAILGKTDLDLFPKERAEAFRVVDAQVISSGTMVQVEELAPQDDGLHNYVSVKCPLFDAEGKTSGVCVISTDITERVLLERRSAFLAQASAKLTQSLDYGSVLKALSHLVVEYLADWCWVDLVEEVEEGEKRHRARAQRDAAHEPILDDMLNRCWDRWAAHGPVARVFLSGEPLLLPVLDDESLERYGVNQDQAKSLGVLGARTAMLVPIVLRGRTIGVLSVASAQPGHRYGAQDVGLARELGEIAALAIDNARLYRSSERAVELREEFLSVASHELNTPIAGLLWSTQSLLGLSQRGDPTLAEPRLKILKLVERQAKRLTRLVSDLLDVSRIQAGKLSVHPEPNVDLVEVVREVVDSLELDLERARCRVSVRAPTPILGCWDRSRLNETVTNLVSNAIKFGAGHPIEIALGQEAGRAWCSVKDYGIGIEHETMGQLFERFKRGVSAQHYGGLGLGLYICKKIVEAHGGSIHVESRPGAGATFTIVLSCGPPLASGRQRGDSRVREDVRFLR
jgi:PAS domain S-box-containing protein